ncbi:hypothetical protein EDD15DRAFT_2200339 [Pisolithus albus]|nr:hypothetical protein EDD15DRAFT_2200339 [Pisolithus albus]
MAWMGVKGGVVGETLPLTGVVSIAPSVRAMVSGPAFIEAKVLGPVCQASLLTVSVKGLYPWLQAVTYGTQDLLHQYHYHCQTRLKLGLSFLGTRMGFGLVLSLSFEVSFNGILLQVTGYQSLDLLKKNFPNREFCSSCHNDLFVTAKAE